MSKWKQHKNEEHEKNLKDDCHYCQDLINSGTSAKWLREMPRSARNVKRLYLKTCKKRGIKPIAPGEENENVPS